MCFLLVDGAADRYFSQMEFMIVTASIVVVRCFVDVTSVKFFAPQLYLQHKYIIHVMAVHQEKI